MTKEDWTRQEPEELASVESFLDKYGELWAEAAVRDSADLTAQFQKRLRRQSVTEKTPSIGLGWFLRPAWMMAAAACVLALFLLPQYWDQSVGRIVYFGGEVRLNEMTPASDFLNSGNEVKVAEEGEAMLSLDGNRVDLFLREGTEVRLASSDSVSLVKGDLWVRVETDSGHFEVTTPNGVVTVHGTTFGVSVLEDQTQVAIAAGEVAVGNPLGTEFIRPGTGATLEGTNRPPSLHSAPGDVTPQWAKDIFAEASAAQAKRFFPSAAP